MIDVHLPESYIISTSESAFDSIVSNLLTNAFKFTRNEDHISLLLANDSLIIQDEGIGIASEHRDSIWDRFWKKDQMMAGSGI